MAVLALAYVMNLSGQTASLGVWLAGTGGAFAIISPILGWIGVAVTGSDTSSNSLFGALQVQAAAKAGLDPVLMAAANSSGGVLGKMVSPQNLAIAAAAVGMSGQRGRDLPQGDRLEPAAAGADVHHRRAAVHAGAELDGAVAEGGEDMAEEQVGQRPPRCSRSTAPSPSSRPSPVPTSRSGVGELAGLTGLPQGTAHRLLQGLQHRGYVRHDASRKYSLGTAALRLADAAQRSLARSARPFLDQLVAVSGETANLAVLEGDDVVYVAQVSSPHTLRMFAEVGRHVPPHSTAVGKVLLAAMPRERALAVVRRTGLARRTPHTITEPEAFAAELDLVAGQGWAADEEEQEIGVRCVAVPVGPARSGVAALSVSGPADRFAGGADVDLVDAMKRVAATFAAG